MPERRGQPWSAEEDDRLRKAWQSGEGYSDMMAVHQRGRGAIRSRLRKLGLDTHRPHTHCQDTCGTGSDTGTSSPVAKPTRPKPTRHGEAWSEDEASDLEQLRREGKTVGQLADWLERSPRAVAIRLESLGLLGEDAPVSAWTADHGGSGNGAAATTSANAKPTEGGLPDPVQDLDAYPDFCLGLSVRAAGALERAGVADLPTFLALDIPRLLKLPNVGRKTIMELRNHQIRAREGATRHAREPHVPRGTANGVAALPSGGLPPLPPVSGDVDAVASALADRVEAILEARRDAGSKREADIVNSRLLAAPDEVVSLRYLGDVHGVTRERIRQLQERILSRCLSPAFAGAAEPLRALAAMHGEAASAEFARAFTELNLAYPLRDRLRSEAWRRTRTPLMGLKAAKATMSRAARSLEREAWRHIRAEARAGRLERHVDFILDGIEWPSAAFDENALRAFYFDRDADSWGRLEPFGPSRLGNNLSTESRLEMSYLKALDASPLVASVRTQALRLPFAKGNRTYHPDFLVTFHDGQQAVIEIKGRGFLATVPTLFKRAVARTHLLPLGIAYRLVGDRGVDLASLAAREVPPQREAGLLHMLAKGPADLAALRPWLNAHPEGILDLQALTLRHRLAFRRRPLRLEKGDGLSKTLFVMSSST